MRELPSTLETIKSKQPGLLSLPTVTSIKGFKGDVIIDGQTIFKNFASVELGVLARGSAPHYTNDDSSQRMSNHAIIFLKNEGFNQVISLNSVELSQSEKNSLTKSGINYIHIKTDDFSSPDKSKLLQSVIAMKGKNTYVYCGYGAGRTGTLVTAWQILNNKGDLTESTIEEANQLAILKDIDEKHAVSNSIERLNIWHG
ncbi:hypothetical protein CKQ84_18790 [Shewanella sp. WE21]|jgi:hypothetical protein|uniref:protein-tyrosine phosphatase family protein n=1 Tax=Shewanella sp. WE21 TaxID=2029986 RepID=UPI000CF62310|nr:dual specificity protein phosphatase family protein [Shewanella sp. WE21]AVI67729.1 hypothetical protein CKQ84_18790 [Shewanella sp. WE21]